ncbi:MAG TPA: hypothetical protein VHT24_11220 [Pseudacidobacterium sp.]|jgi:hypothetical protein|nr:hypothetical protein [Pseudacidobacterium sp.]
MAASPNRSTVTIDGNKFDCVSVSVALQTEKDRAGMPQMGSLSTSIKAYVDFHDDQNLPFSTLKQLFDLSNVVTRDKIRDVKVEFWKDDAKQDALLSYSFKGWVSAFHTLNPYQNDNGNGSVSDSSADHVGVNHMLVLELEPALNQQNYKDVTVSN